jgi:hypothetical protein
MTSWSTPPNPELYGKLISKQWFYDSKTSQFLPDVYALFLKGLLHEIDFKDYIPITREENTTFYLSGIECVLQETTFIIEYPILWYLIGLALSDVHTMYSNVSIPPQRRAWVQRLLFEDLWKIHSCRIGPQWLAQGQILQLWMNSTDESRLPFAHIRMGDGRYDEPAANEEGKKSLKRQRQQNKTSVDEADQLIFSVRQCSDFCKLAVHFFALEANRLHLSYPSDTLQNRFETSLRIFFMDTAQRTLFLARLKEIYEPVRKGKIHYQRIEEMILSEGDGWSRIEILQLSQNQLLSSSRAEINEEEIAKDLVARVQKQFKSTFLLPKTKKVKK